MSAGSFLLGCAFLAATTGPLLFGSVRWRRRLAPHVDQPTGWLIDLTLTFFAMIAVAEVLGSVGAFRRWPVTLANVGVGVTAALTGRTAPRRARTRTRTRTDPLTAFALLIAALVIARWSVGILTALSNGPLDSDTQTYHLPGAARFVQDGWLTRLNFATVDDAVPYHPLNSELLHALTMLAFGRDIASPFVNLLWLAGALGAAWSIGEHWRRGALSSIALSALLGTRLLWETQAGSAMSDVVGVCFLLIAVALLLRAATGTVPIVMAGLASGLALGSKLTVAVPVVALAVIGVSLAPSVGRKRWGVTRSWILAMIAGAGFWYVRNVVYTGNPVPSVRLGLGDLALPRPPMQLIDRYGFSVADYALDVRAWREFFLPGLARAFGPIWPVLVVVPIGAAVVAVVSARSLFLRGLGAVALASTLAYVFTPTTALGPPGAPVLFGANLRYLTPALALGLVMAPSLWARRSTTDATFAAVLATPLIIDLHGGWNGRATAAVIAALVIPGICVAAYGASRMPGRWAPAVVTVVLTVLLGGSFLLQRDYLRSRYRSESYRRGRNHAAFAWAQDVSQARIGMAGFFVNYPLYGSDLSNRVRYVGVHRSDGAFVDAKRCSEWRRRVNDGDFDYVVTMPPFPDFPVPQAADWTRSDPSTVEVLRRDKESVFAVMGDLDPSSCPR